jgi:predicted nucleotidyltransferase
MKKKIFQEIRSEVQKILPDAKVSLFGSRVYGDASEESDWDILILTSDKPNYENQKNNSG